MTYIWLPWMADVLRGEGCNVKEYEGWKNRGRPSSSGQFNPYGVDLHHTGTKTSYSNPNPTLSTCVYGRPDLSGPLCQVMIGYDGVCHVIAAGRANHGGEHSGAGPFPPGDCNAMMVGIEVDYSGSQAVSPEQGDAAIRATAAILRKFGRNEAYCLGHKETSVTGKWDPGKEGSNSSLYKMSEVRGFVKDALAGNSPYPEEEKIEEDDMFICHSTDDRQWLIVGIGKFHIKNMADVDALKKSGVNDAGEKPSAMLAYFATLDPSDVSNLYAYGAERQVAGLTKLDAIQATLDEDAQPAST
jgi:hypothetical protein